MYFYNTLTQQHQFLLLNFLWQIFEQVKNKKASQKTERL